MPAPKLSFRVSPERYATIIKLAEVERKTVTELMNELIDTGLGQRATADADIKAELQFLEVRLSELIARGIKGSAVAAYYAKLATETTDETACYITTDGQVLDPETKKKRAQERQKRAREIAKHFLTAPLEKI